MNTLLISHMKSLILSLGLVKASLKKIPSKTQLTKEAKETLDNLNLALGEVEREIKRFPYWDY